MELRGPHELMRYKPNAYRTIGMIAGSTGIAPLIQVIHEAMFSAVDYTEIKVPLFMFICKANAVPDCHHIFMEAFPFFCMIF